MTEISNKAQLVCAHALGFQATGSIVHTENPVVPEAEGTFLFILSELRVGQHSKVRQDPTAPSWVTFFEKT